MDDLDDPYSLSLISLVMMLSMNLILSNNIIQSYKTYVIRRVRASVSAIMYELGSGVMSKDMSQGVRKHKIISRYRKILGS